MRQERTGGRYLQNVQTVEEPVMHSAHTATININNSIYLLAQSMFALRACGNVSGRLLRTVHCKQQIALFGKLYSGGQPAIISKNFTLVKLQHERSNTSAFST